MPTGGLTVTIFVMAVTFLQTVDVVAAPAINNDAPDQNVHTSQHPAQVQLAGLWDKPNQACMTQCQVLVDRGCFKEQAEKNPAANAASLQDYCENKYSLCLYDCMCENCKDAQKQEGQAN